jgi:hypothetical protein
MILTRTTVVAISTGEVAPARPGVDGPACVAVLDARRVSPMLKLLRVVLLFVVAVLLVEAVVAVTSAGTGVVEKAVILVAGVALVAALPRVRRVGAQRVH